MDDNDNDPNASMFPLFNFDALKHGFPNIPINTTFNDIILKPQEDSTILRAPTVPVPKPAVKKRGRKSTKKSIDSKSSLATIKEILENDQAGVPMINDAKMKEEKLKKMREGKAKKREQRAEGLIQSIEPQKEFETLAALMPSVGGKAQALLGSSNEIEENIAIPSQRVVFKDGKYVLEDTGALDFVNKEKKDKITPIDDSKMHKLTSMSFRKKNHTKQWTKDETKKLYKAVEIFGSDFSMMTKLFPTRNRAQIKNKLRKEEKENPKKVEEAFKKHELSHKKSLMARIQDFGRKQLKVESGDQMPTLESIANPDLLNPQNRTISSCSLDSMDMSILNDLKSVFAQESGIKPGDLLNIQTKVKKELPFSDEKLKKESSSLNLGFLASPERDKKRNEVKMEVSDKPKMEFAEGNRSNNLLFGLLSKEQANI